MQNKWKLIIGVLGAILIIGIKLGLKFGLGYGIAAAEIEASKADKWPEDFKKTFVESCAATEGDHRQLIAFCECATDRLEAAQIIPTKFNSLKENENQYGERVGKIISDYFDSAPGQKITHDCTTASKTAMAK